MKPIAGKEECPPAKASPAERVARETGCSVSQAEALIADAKAKGMSPDDYVQLKGWDFTPDEIPAFLEATRRQAAHECEWQEWYVKVVCERMGLGYDEARERMDAAKEKGYTYRMFIKCGLCRMTDEELTRLEPYQEPAKKPAKPRPAKKAVVYNRKLPFEPLNSPSRSGRPALVTDLNPQRCLRIMEATGWTVGQLRTDFLLAKANCGCFLDEYERFKLYRMPPEEQKTYVTMELHVKMYLRYADYGGSCRILENKGEFNAFFSDFIRRRWFLSKDLTWEAFLEGIEGLDALFVKEAGGIGGKGAGRYEVNASEEQNREVFGILEANPDLICEECFVQHPDIAEIYPGAVGTIRVFTFLRDGMPEVLFAAIRVGLDGVMDNLSSGGMMCAINLENGQIETHGATIRRERVEAHPVTGIRFLGREIPNWEKVFETAKAAALMLPDNPFVGWDIAIGWDGTPELIEGNHNPALGMMQPSWVVGPEIRGNAHITYDLANDFSHPSRRAAARRIMRESGCTQEEAEALLVDAEARGIDRVDYLEFRGWELTPDEPVSIPAAASRVEAS